MASVINTNVASLNAQRNLVNSQNSLSTSIQRLSSGLRINSAKDDAAGLAISERFSSQIRGLNQAARNANDAISLTQTAEGAMTQISDNLQRVRELAVQSSNATNSESDRKAMQKEVTALLSEIDRVASQTDFNGTKLLDGTYSGQQMQIGANAGQTIGISGILNAKQDSLGGSLFASGDITAAKLTVAQDAGAGDFKFAAGTIADFSITANGKTVDFKGVKYEAGQADTQTNAETASIVSQGKAIAAAINEKSSELGISASVDETTGKVSLSSFMEGKVGDKITGTSLTVNSTALADTDKKFISNISIESFEGAQQAIQIADNALNAVNDARADMGAIQNRFSSVISNLQSSTENLSASQSRIRDTDYASETAKLTRNQILQQAGTAMLAQANSLPNSVLSLLG